MKKVLFNILSVSLLIIFLFSCIEDPEVSPGVRGARIPVFEGGTTISGGKTANSVEISAKIAMEYGSKITERGFYYGLSNPPNPGNGGKTVKDDGLGIGSYSKTIEGLINDTTYYFLPYAINDIGAGYGDILSVRTNHGLGSVTTIKPYDEHASSFKAGFIVISEGEGDSDKITKGIYLYTNINSAPIDTITNDAIYVGDSIIFQVKNVLPSTQYYVKAFITNVFGTFTGSAESITTKDGKFVVGETTITPGYTDATFISSVNNGGDATVIIEERGFCWSKTVQIPTLNDSVLRCGDGVGDFNGIVKNLEAQAGYYVRAYAKNNFGVIEYGSAKPFNTKKDVPSVVTETIDESKVQSGNAEIRGVITDGGRSEILFSGICWSSSNQTPDEVLDNFQYAIAASGGVFTVRLSGLRGGTRYYVRAFARNSDGVSYGEVKNFITPPVFDSSLSQLSESMHLQNSTAYFVIDGNLCILGGDLGANYTNEFLMYNISSNSWSPRQPFVGGSAKWQSGVSYGSGAYVYGGYDGSADEKEGLYYYNYNYNQWSHIDGPDSVTVCRALGYANSNSVFFIGGTSGDSVRSDVWSYIAQNYWEKKTDFPVEQYGGFAVVIDNIAYAGMGKNSSDVCNGKLWTTANGANSWELKTECTIYTGSILAGVACNKRIYIIDESYKILEYDPVTDIWRIKSQLPVSHQIVHCMFSVNNKIYIGLGSSKSILVYDPLWDN